MDVPFQPIDEAKAEKIATRKNEKQRAKYPLFADQLDAVTGEQVKRAFDGHAARFAACCRLLFERGESFKEQVRPLVSKEEFAALEARRANLPDVPEYHANFWREQWEALTCPKGSETP